VSDDYLWDGTGEPDPEVARLEKALAPLRHEGVWREPAQLSAQREERPIERPRRFFRRPAFVAGTALALAAGVALAVGASTWRTGGAGQGAALSGTSSLAASGGPQSGAVPAPVVTVAAPPNPCLAGAGERGFPFDASGDATCDGQPVRAGSLPVGAWLETAHGSMVHLRVADIGAIAVRGGSKLRVVETGPSQHRLELVRGSLHARVDAPPRLFVIDTRAAQAVDLGCAYDLRVDGEGRTHLAVTVGVVSLEGKGRAAYVPRGTHVTADPERGPGTVVAESAPADLRAAAERLDAGDASALATVLSLAAKTDSVTLWNLLATTEGEARESVLARMDQLGLRPANVHREALLAGKPEALAALRDRIEEDWFRAPPRKQAP
jgi:hypothetical protein